MEFLYLLIPSLIVVIILSIYLIHIQSKVINELNVGDRIVFDGQEGEILEKDGIQFTIKIKVSGMRLSKLKLK
jgi:hypothetical protein